MVLRVLPQWRKLVHARLYEQRNHKFRGIQTRPGSPLLKIYVSKVMKGLRRKCVTRAWNTKTWLVETRAFWKSTNTSEEVFFAAYPRALLSHLNMSIPSVKISAPRLCCRDTLISHSWWAHGHSASSALSVWPSMLRVRAHPMMSTIWRVKPTVQIIFWAQVW